MDINKKKVKDILSKKEYLAPLRTLAVDLKLEETLKIGEIRKDILQKLLMNENNFIDNFLNNLNSINTDKSKLLKNDIETIIKSAPSINTVIDPLEIILKGNDVSVGGKLVNIKDVSINEEPATNNFTEIKEIEEEIVETQLPQNINEIEEEIVETQLPQNINKEEIEEEIIEENPYEIEEEIVLSPSQYIITNEEDDIDKIITNLENLEIKETVDEIITDKDNIQKTLDEITCSSLKKFNDFDEEEKTIIKLFGLV